MSDWGERESVLSESGIHLGQESGLHQESVCGSGSGVSFWSGNIGKVIEHTGPFP